MMSSIRVTILSTSRPSMIDKKSETFQVHNSRVRCIIAVTWDVETQPQDVDNNLKCKFIVLTPKQSQKISRVETERNRND